MASSTSRGGGVPRRRPNGSASPKRPPKSISAACQPPPNATLTPRSARPGRRSTTLRAGPPGHRQGGGMCWDGSRPRWRRGARRPRAGCRSRTACRCGWRRTSRPASPRYCCVTTPAWARRGQEEKRAGMLGKKSLIRREPIGVVAAIVPWNVPQAISFLKLGPALAAGNAVVLKPAPETVLDAFLMAEAALEAGLPPGVLNVVPAGREVGAYLVAHPGVDKVSFTGSTAAGRAIAETCGPLLRPGTLEAGGKSAAIILDDADLTASLEPFFG